MACQYLLPEYFTFISIDNGIHRMLSYSPMNEELKAEFRTKLAALHDKGWTFASIASAIGQSTVTIEAWNRGIRSPANLRSVLAALDALIALKRIPKKKIYSKPKMQS